MYIMEVRPVESWPSKLTLFLSLESVLRKRPEMLFRLWPKMSLTSQNCWTSSEDC